LTFVFQNNHGFQFGIVVGTVSLKMRFWFGSNLISRKIRESLVQTLDSCEWRSVKGRSCAYTTSDRTTHKNFTPVRHAEAMFQIWWRSVDKWCHILVHRRQPDGLTDGQTDVYVILYSVQCIRIALNKQKWPEKQKNPKSNSSSPKAFT